MNQPTEKSKQPLNAIFTFRFGRSLYSICLDNILKATLLEHKIYEQIDDKKTFKENTYVLSVTTNNILSQSDDGKPVYESLMEIQGGDDDYVNLYNTYTNLIEAWNMYDLAKIATIQ